MLIRGTDDVTALIADLNKNQTQLIPAFLTEIKEALRKEQEGREKREREEERRRIEAEKKQEEERAKQRKEKEEEQATQRKEKEDAELYIPRRFLSDGMKNKLAAVSWSLNC